METKIEQSPPSGALMDSTENDYDHITDGDTSVKVELDSNEDWNDITKSDKHITLDGTLYYRNDRILATITNEQSLAWTVVNRMSNFSSQRGFRKG
jgi:hypothetical protein